MRLGEERAFHNVHLVEHATSQWPFCTCIWYLTLECTEIVMSSHVLPTIMSAAANKLYIEVQH